MASTHHNRIFVHGRAFDVSISRRPGGREVVHVRGPELQQLMQANEYLDFRAAFVRELDRVRAKRRT